MTMTLMHQIQLAERELTTVDHSADPRFVPNANHSLREFGARLLRTSAVRGLRLADRLDRQYA
jgi:hypothetical protein